jgi:hypothetical protein
VKKILAIFMFVFMFLLLVQVNVYIEHVKATSTTNTSVTVSNTAPDFATGGEPYEVPASYSGTPINVGASISFYATGEDANSDQYYLAICQTDAVTAGNNAAPTCTGGSWCVSSATNSGVATSCTYNALQTDPEGPNVWYAFICDKVTGVGDCSASQQGTGNSGSPFYINHRPSFSQITDDGGGGANSGADPGGSMTFTATASDPDTDGTSDTVKLVVCADTTGATYGGCSGTQLCVSSDSASNPSCVYTIPSVKDNGNYNYYAYVFDSHQLASASNYISGQYAVNNVAPVVSNVVINGGSTITLIEDTTTNITVTATVADNNSCVDISSVKSSIYRAPTYDYAACDDSIAEGNPNYCYAEITCSVAAGTCTGNTDGSANYNCTISFQFHADPTTGDGTDPTDPTWYADTWKSTVRAYDSAANHYFESVSGVEVQKTLGINITTSIAYGSMTPDQDTGTTLDSDSDKTTPVEATGNVGMDLGFSGTDMCTSFTPPNTCGGSTIPVGNQKYAYNVTQFIYSSEGTALTGTASEEEVNVPKTTITAIKANKKILWGIFIPPSTGIGTYSGQNTLTAYMGESANW